MKRLQSAIFVIILMMLLSGCGDERGFVSEDFEDTSEVSETEIVTEDISSEEVGQIIVDVEGEILNPGVYQLPAGSRVSDAIRAAGGFTDSAVALTINQAQTLSDGEQIIVSSVDATKEDSLTEDDGLVNINNASKDELMTLPGIGESRAEDIISYRDTNGGFKSAEDIKNVPGIKEGLYKKIKDRIKV